MNKFLYELLLVLSACIIVSCGKDDGGKTERNGYYYIYDVVYLPESGVDKDEAEFDLEYVKSQLDTYVYAYASVNGVGGSVNDFYRIGSLGAQLLSSYGCFSGSLILMEGNKVIKSWDVVPAN